MSHPVGAAPTTSPVPRRNKSWSAPVWLGVMTLSVVLFRWGVLEAFTIPTPSMEGSLLVGDLVLVSKLHYGPITPQTPLQIPLTHQTFPVLGFKSYSDLIQLPTWRLPGFSEVKRNDVVVFHVPFEDQYPADLRTNYIKRCVAVAGDTLQLRGGQVFLNGRPGAVAGQPQTTYFLAVKDPSPEVQTAIQAQGIVDYSQPGSIPQPVQGPNGEVGYVLNCSAATADYFRQQPYAQSLTIIQLPVRTFPDVVDFPDQSLNSATPRSWQLDDYGPLPVPKKGQIIALTPANAAIYYKIVVKYEHTPGVTWQNGMMYQNGQPLTSYTVKQNYYWMMGDNRHNSEDSRFWGFVPEDHLVGKAVTVFMSVDPATGLARDGRWLRAVE